MDGFGYGCRPHEKGAGGESTGLLPRPQDSSYTLMLLLKRRLEGCIWFWVNTCPRNAAVWTLEICSEHLINCFQHQVSSLKRTRFLFEGYLFTPFSHLMILRSSRHHPELEGWSCIHIFCWLPIIQLLFLSAVSGHPVLACLLSAPDSTVFLRHHWSVHTPALLTWYISTLGNNNNHVQFSHGCSLR